MKKIPRLPSPDCLNQEVHRITVIEKPKLSSSSRQKIEKFKEMEEGVNLIPPISKEERVVSLDPKRSMNYRKERRFTNLYDH